jgi:hypothetical protein
MIPFSPILENFIACGIVVSRDAWLLFILDQRKPQSTKLQMHFDQIADSIFLSFSWIKQLKKSG